MAKRRSDTEPGTHRIIGKQGAFYVVEDEHGNTEHKTRIKLSYYILKINFIFFNLHTFIIINTWR